MKQSVPMAIAIDESRLETGLWCQRCLLPSGWRAPLLGTTSCGVGELGVIERCSDCEQPLDAAP